MRENLHRNERAAQISHRKYRISQGHALPAWEKIAELLGISTKTLSRRRKEFQLNDEESFYSLTDEELVTIMQEIMNVTPGIGQMRMLGTLKSSSLDRMDNIEKYAQVVDTVQGMLLTGN